MKEDVLEVPNRAIVFWYSIEDMKTGFRSDVYKNVLNDLYAVDTMNKEGLRISFTESIKSEEDCYEVHHINIDAEINK